MKLAARVEKLETQLRIFSRSHVWVDVFDSTVRVDFDHKRGDVLTFDSPRECVSWVDLQLAQFPNVAGVACFEDVSQLLEGEALEIFNSLMAGAPTKAVLISLAGGTPSIAYLAIISWWHNLTGIAYQDWRKEVEGRIEVLLNSLEVNAAQ